MRRLGPLLLAAYVVLAAVTLVVVVFGRGRIDEGFLVLALLGFAIVGRVLTARVPGNAVGWVLAWVAVVFAAQGLSEGFVKSMTADDSRTLVQVAGWLSDWVWYFWLGLVAIALPLLFPDGRLPSRRWRPVAWAGVVATFGGALSNGLRPGPMDLDAPRTLDNPVGVEGIAGLLSAIETASLVLAVFGFVGGGAAVVVRLRRSHGVERQQLKWFAYAASGMVLGLVVAAFSTLFGDATWALVLGAAGWMSALGLMAIGIPVATGIAVLRYRLYDIDVVINRTLVYVGLTATLAGAYLAIVLMLQVILSPGSDLAIAGSTLAVAALFRPLRRRIQDLVDRRFYRRRFDAARTVSAFSGRVRDEVDLDALAAALRSVVAETMQPQHASLWLRDRAGSR